MYMFANNLNANDATAPAQIVKQLDKNEKKHRPDIHFITRTLIDKCICRDEVQASEIHQRQDLSLNQSHHFEKMLTTIVSE